MQISIFINSDSILTSVSKNTNKHHCDGCSATVPLGKVFCSMKLHVFSVRWSHLMTQVNYLSLNHLLTFSGPRWSPRPHWSPWCPRLPGQCADKSHFTHISVLVSCCVLHCAHHCVMAANEGKQCLSTCQDWINAVINTAQ